jgi:hypothetical protein
MLLLAHQLGHAADEVVIGGQGGGDDEERSVLRWFRVFAVAFLGGLLWS